MGTFLSRDGSAAATLAVCTAAAGGGLVLGLALGRALTCREFNKRQQNMANIVGNMHFVGNITELFIFPLKSARPVVVSEAKCTPLGLVSGDIRDRVFLITDENYHFLTARQEGAIILIQPSYNGDELWLDAPGMKTFKLKIPASDNKSKKIRIFGQDSRGIDCGDDVAAWLTKYLNRSENTTRLVYHPWDTMERIPDNWDKFQLFKKTDTGVYCDLTTFMIVNQASLDELNKRLKKKVTVRHFRPNMLVNGKIPFHEDNWTHVKIGSSTMFRCIQPCTRCVMTTIDPETGVRSPDGDPLETLKSYRKVKSPEYRKLLGESPGFGEYMGIDVPGIIRVGDPVYAAEGGNTLF